MSINDGQIALTQASVAMPRDFLDLMKPRVMSLVVFTALVGLVMAPGTISPLLGAIAILAVAIGAGASGVLNMWYDADIDRVMGRTASRPIPSGRVSRDEALTFGLSLSGFSVVLLGIFTNWLAAGLLAFTIFFYAVLYTIWLKRSTPQNIVIGGAAGAFPPVIGWAAVTGDIAVEPLILFAIIFLWTPPHFWALALFKAADYRRANVPMLPNVAGNAETQRQIFFYSIALAACGVLPFLLGFAGIVYGATALAFGVAFVHRAWQVRVMAADDTAMLPAKRLFGFSILYLFTLFAVLLCEQIIASLL